MKIRPVGADMFHAGGRTDGVTDCQTEGRTERETDMTKLTVAFRNFANAPKNTLFNKTSLYTIKEHCEQLSRQRK